MSFASIKAKAEEMGISIAYAVDCRIRYLKSQIDMLVDIEEGVDATCPVCKELAWREVSHNADMIHRYRQDIIRLKMGLKGKTSKEAITDEMIERARMYPVEQLIEFNRGKARCFNHEEQTPSLSHDRKRNLVHCFGQCSKSWNSIGILMDRDGLKFVDAVKQLQ